MLNFKVQSNRIKKTFFSVVDQNTFAATLMLGNLYYSLQKAPPQEQPLLQNTLLEIKANLTPQHIQLLFDTAISISEQRLNLMSEANVFSLDLLKHQMIQDSCFFKDLTVDSLIKVGQNISFYREVLVALFRKHLDQNGQTDPFKRGDFSYALLTQGAAEQNAGYLADFIKKCSISPIDDMVLLGTKNSEIAKLILLDIKDTQTYFEVSNRLVHLHANLRQDIAKDWKDHLQIMPLTTKEDAFAQTELPRLKEMYKEFEEINLDKDLEPNDEVEPDERIKLIKLFTGAGLASVGTAAGISFHLTQLGFVMLIPPLAVTAPVCYGVIFGGYYLCKHSNFSSRTQFYRESLPNKKERVRLS